MCGLTNASTSVVTARSYSRYSGNTSHDNDSTASVRGIGVGMHQANADGAQALAPKELGGGVRACLVERPQFLTLVIEASADLTHEAQRHDALRLHPEIGVAVALRHRLAGDFQDVAEALGDDQAEGVDLALQQRVRCN